MSGGISIAIVYTPKGRKNARDFARRVYFSCHEDDHTLLDSVSQQLRKIIADCVIAFRDPETPKAPDHFEEVVDFPLVVIPVTKSWFQEGLQQQEFALLKEQNKPMIPILFDDTLVETFNDHTEDMQFLRVSDPEYPEKLRRALQSMLLDQETVEQIHKVFTHKLFIAYCREDLEQVRRLISCIRHAEVGRQISIWFDKYLQAGRNFEEVIFSQLDDSQLFGMVLTPHLVQRDTYVKRQEYPRALAGGKRTILFQMADANWQDLYAEMEAIAREQGAVLPEKQRPVPVDRDDAFAVYVKKLLREVKGHEGVEKELDRDYLLGLAYRNGIGAEFDYRYAMKKFRAAAAKGDSRAAHNLAEMYENGIGVRRDMKQAKKWYIREIEYRVEEYKIRVNEYKLMPMPIAVLNNGVRMNLCGGMIEDVKEQILSIAGELVRHACENAQILRDNGYWEEAEALYRMAKRALEWSENNANQIGVMAKYEAALDTELNRYLISCGKQDRQACRECWEKTFSAWEADDPESCRIAVISGHNYATVLLFEGRGKLAAQIMEQVLTIIEATRGTMPQSIMEMQLQLYRDIGMSYLIESHQDAAQKNDNAAKALAMLQKELQLLTEYPFDVDANPYLLFKYPWNSVNIAKAYFYREDYEKAYLSLLTALQKGIDIQIQLGDLSTQRDMPLSFLQLYATIAQWLRDYRNLPEDITTVFRKLTEQLESLSYNGEHRRLAQDYFTDLRTALQEWENETQ